MLGVAKILTISKLSTFRAKISSPEYIVRTIYCTGKNILKVSSKIRGAHIAFLGVMNFQYMYPEKWP